MEPFAQRKAAADARRDSSDNMGDLVGCLSAWPATEAAPEVVDVARHPGLGIGDQADIAFGQIGRGQPFLVARHVHQHHQQATDIALGDCRGEVERIVWRFDVHGVS